jgi:phi13 family phage major tail protein
MATIGLDKPFYATITEDAEGVETYGTPIALAKAISAELSVNIAEATLYADDGASEVVREFTSGQLTLGVDNLGVEKAAALTGSKVDDNGVLVSTSEDSSPTVAIGFRAKKSNGNYRYFWLYRVKFGVPNVTLATKGESITFNTPSIVGTITRRNKPDGEDTHPWKAEVDSDDTGVPPGVIAGWFTQVYEPDFTP